MKYAITRLTALVAVGSTAFLGFGSAASASPLAEQRASAGTKSVSNLCDKVLQQASSETSILRIHPCFMISELKRRGADRIADRLIAATHYRTREGHLRVPRDHMEIVDGVVYRLGEFLAAARVNRERLGPAVIGVLDALGMRWKR